MGDCKFQLHSAKLNPNTVLVGPGAIGMLLAAHFCSATDRLWLLDHRPDRAAWLDQHGIHVQGDSPRHVPVRATDDPDFIGKADLVLLCVKSFDAQNALARIAPMVREGTIIITMQNGFDVLDVCASYSGPGCVFIGSTSYGAACTGEWGCVVPGGDGVVRLAPFSEGAEDCISILQSFFEKAGLVAEVVSDAESMIWTKGVISAGINPVSCLYGLRNGEILAHPEALKRMHQAVLEAATLADCLNIPLMVQNPVSATEDVCRKTANNISSMLQDRRNGSRSELEAITGFLLRRAAHCGHKMPETQRLHEECMEIMRT